MSTRSRATNPGSVHDVNRPLRLLVVVDSLLAMEPTRGRSFAMQLESRRQEWSSSCAELGDLWVRDGLAWGRVTGVAGDARDHRRRPR